MQVDHEYFMKLVIEHAILGIAASEGVLAIALFKYEEST